MNGYLLDNNVISVAGRRSDQRYPALAKLMGALGTSPIFLPVIALAEIEFGLAKVPRLTPDPLRDELRAFFSLYDILPFGENTVEPYATLRARLWNECATPRVDSKGRTRGHSEKLPEELPLFDRVTGKQLKIDERDLQIVSISVEYELILVTNDSNSEMKRIDEIGKMLLAEGKLDWFQIDFWVF